jgi:hypothetical protein
MMAGKEPEVPQDPVLDEENAAFIQGGVSIIAASRDAANRPAVVRALGCRVSPDRRRIAVFIARSQGAELLEDVGATGEIAVVFVLPSTHRAIQLKGSDARLEPLATGDLESMARLVETFAADLAALGYTTAFVRALLACEPGDAVAIAFTPTAAFSQTPGARAGAPLRA